MIMTDNNKKSVSNNRIVEWIIKARKVHGDKYDYSKVKYINNHTKVFIICKEHGEFEQIPKSHLKGSGCLKCSNKYSPTTEEFIEEAKKVHGDKYDYSKVVYIRALDKIIIICKKHGEFKQRAVGHKRGQECPNCIKEKRKALAQVNGMKKFLKKAKEIHGNRYDYSKVKYTGSSNKVTIICKEHGEFKQIACNHMKGANCPDCIKEERKALAQVNGMKKFLKNAAEIHGDKYDYSKVVYVGTEQKVIIICQKHGEFKQTPHSHIGQKAECNKCSYEKQGRAKRKTIEVFIKEAKNIHGDKYDYSKVEYVNSRAKVIIICREHGEFEQTPNNHISQKQGCSKCSGKYSPTTEEWVEKAIKVHGDKYDYSKAEYTGKDRKITIICREHGEFKQIASSHLRGLSAESGQPRGAGCSKCSGCYSPTTEEWIEKAIKVHGDKFDYSKVEYVNSGKHIDIICKEHGKFQQTPEVHLRGFGCSKCSGNYRPTTQEWIEKAIKVRGDRYDYSKVEYISTQKKIIIICKEHGKFEQTPSNHLLGANCPKCAGTHSPTTQEWIEKAIKVRGDRYDYSKVEYKKALEKIIIICKKHGEFEQMPAAHLTGAGCPNCYNKTEGKLHNWLRERYPDDVKHHQSFDWCKKKKCLPFDWCIEKFKIIIELDGVQHFEYTPHFHRNGKEDLYYQQQIDCFKMKKANENGYSVIRLLQKDVWDNKHNWKKKLLKTIKKYDTPTNVFICINNEYEVLKNTIIMRPFLKIYHE